MVHSSSISPISGSYWGTREPWTVNFSQIIVYLCPGPEITVKYMRKYLLEDRYEMNWNLSSKNFQDFLWFSNVGFKLKSCSRKPILEKSILLLISLHMELNTQVRRSKYIFVLHLCQVHIKNPTQKFEPGPKKFRTQKFWSKISVNISWDFTFLQSLNFLQDIFQIFFIIMSHSLRTLRWVIFRRVLFQESFLSKMTHYF